jgi:hypothetical protein
MINEPSPAGDGGARAQQGSTAIVSDQPRVVAIQDAAEQWASALLAYVFGLFGCPVAMFPCRGKMPLISGGFTSAACDLATIAAWAAKFRFMQPVWAVATGLQTNGRYLLAVDVDPRSGGAISPAWPSTLTISTPSGGQHAFYWADRPIRGSAGKFAPGVDIRCVGGYVALGGPGRQVLDHSSVCDLPRWMADRAEHGPDRVEHGADRHRDTVTPRRQRGGPRVHLGEQITEGGRNDGLASVAGQLLWRGVDDLASELLAYNERYCVPPLDGREVEQIAASISRSAAGSEREWPNRGGHANEAWRGPNNVTIRHSRGGRS